MLVAINGFLPSFLASPSMPTTVEFVGVKIKQRTFNAHISCSHINPASDIAIYLKQFVLIKNITSRFQQSEKLIVLDDFNLLSVSWVFNDDFECYIPFSYPLIYNEFFDGLGLCQLKNLLT